MIHANVIYKGRCKCIENSRGHKKDDLRNYFITDHGSFMVQIRDTKDSGYDGYIHEEFEKFYEIIEMN